MHGKNSSIYVEYIIADEQAGNIRRKEKEIRAIDEINITTCYHQNCGRRYQVNVIYTDIFLVYVTEANAFPLIKRALN